MNRRDLLALTVLMAITLGVAPFAHPGHDHKVLGTVTMAAADHVIIPTQTEPLALHGLKGMCRTADMIQRSRHRVLPVSILPTLHDRRTRTGADTLKAMQDEYGERVWNDAIPNDTRICSVDALTRSSPAAQYPGRGLSAYRRALDWLLLTEARDTEQAA